MASLIQTYYEQSQLSDAAYAILTTGMSIVDYRAALEARGFTEKEAVDFADKYAIVDVFSDDETSFYAVLFQERDGNGNLTNKKTLAIRGTNDPFDLFITDQQLALFGATSQDFSMRASYADILAELAPTDVLTVAGHSLGGFLAQAFATDFPYTISRVYTYNGAGLGSFLSNPFGLIGISKAIPNDLITNLVGQGQTLVASTGTQLGSKQNIFIEETSVLVNPIANHLIEPLKDSLALYALFATIDPSLDQNISSITEILNASSSVPAMSLENALDTLRRLFQGATVPRTTLDDRGAYYNNLQNLKTFLSPDGEPLTGQNVVSLVDMSAGSIAALARQDGAYRYALNELNPFVVLGANYAPHNSGGVLDLYRAETGQGTWTTIALSDRAELLTAKIQVNVADGGLLAGLRADTHFVDLQTGLEFGNTLVAIQDTIFGDDRVGDVISGRGGDDHLYGRGGADTIEGRDGRDYIEGNEGNDVLLSGGRGNDIILGQEGDDTLDGGDDNDRLNGGLGDDTLKGGDGADQYTYFTGQGRDTINDSDNAGSILFDRQTLVGGIRRKGDPAETYRSSDGQFTYVKSGTDLVINDTITIKNFDFQHGALGIKLADTGELVDGTGPTINYDNGQATVTYVGDETNNWPIFDAAANHVVYGNGGNDYLILASSSALYNHQIFGGVGHDRLESGAGQDRLYGESGRDMLYGGAGDDVLDGGSEDDGLWGGAGRDVLDGGTGDDGLTGEGGNDILRGGLGADSLGGDAYNVLPADMGADYLDGGAGDDWLFGMLEDDVLMGGADADYLYGDQIPDYAPNAFYDWPGLIETRPGIVFASVTGGADYLDGEGGDDYLQGDAGDDVLLGGDGADELWGDDQQVAVIEEGDDWLEGGAGNDQLVGGGGEDALFGGDDDDVLVGDYANNSTDGFADTLDGGAGNDELQGGGGDDVLDGGTGNDRLFGEDGDDSLYGGTGDDQLQGGEGNDVLVGEEGLDVLLGEAGDDVLFGDENDDQLSGGAGFDELDGGTGDDLLFGGDDDDTLFGDDGADELQGGDGNDQLVGEAGDDRLYGDAGDDTLWGDDGADVLSGDMGNDVLDGGTGSDAYVFNLGDGHDVIFDEAMAGGGNQIQFGSGIVQESLTFIQDEANETLTIQIGGGADTIQLNGFSLANWSPVVDTLVFADGSAVYLTDLLPAPEGPIQGTSAANSIRTGAGDNVISAGGGDDAVFAGAGNDTVLGESGNDALDGGDGNDRLVGGSGNDTLTAGGGDDVLIGGTGNDALVGGLGQDTYHFTAGDGSDNIVDASGEGNRLIFGSGIALENVSLEVGVAGSLIIHTGAANDQIQIANFNPLMLTGSKPVESFEFADGTVLDYAQLAQRGFTFFASQTQGTLINGSGFNDVMIGGPYNDRLSGYEGDDRLEGNDYYDTLIGGDGNDYLEGGDGDDELFGENGDDVHLGGNGNDYIVGTGDLRYGSDSDYYDGGLGNDLLADAEGSNTYVFSRGSGRDVIQNVDDVPGQDIDMLRLIDILPSDVIVRPYDGINLYSFGFGDADTDLEIVVNGTSDSILLNYWIEWRDSEIPYNPYFQMERIEFADGTTWSTADLIAHAQGVTRLGTEFDDQGYGSRLDGTVFDDVLMGFAGDDELTGYKGDDLLDGGPGNDYLDGGTGSDTYVFGKGYGADWIYEDLYWNGAFKADDTDVVQVRADVSPDEVMLQASPNNDLVLRIAGTADELTIAGFFEDLSAEIEAITFADGTIWDSAAIRARATGMDIAGTESDDILAGTVLDDVLNGLGGADILDGVGGNDQLIGGAGDDTYVFNRDSGQDAIQDTATAGELNHLRFGGGISASEIVLAQGAGTLTLTLDGTTDQVLLAAFDPTGVAGSLVVGSLDFVNGFQVSTAGFVNGQYSNGDDTIIGAAEADVLVGNAGQDDLSGGLGDDVLIGGAGNDVYRFNLGDGVDSIDDRLTEQNRLIFGAGIAPDLIRAQVRGTMLTLRVGETGDAIRIAGFNSSDPTGPLSVNQFEFADGTVKTPVQLLAGGFDILGTDGNDTVYGTALDDRLIGGKGEDVLYGSSGADTYVFNLGDGHDTIGDYNFANLPGDSNTIRFGTGIISSDLTFLRDGLDLLIRVGTAGDALSLQYFGLGYSTVQTLEFADGTTIDITNILNTPLGTTASETITGASGNDTIFGGGGNDTLNGGAGNDILVAGNGGSVSLNGGAGNDTLFAGTGTMATFSGGAGNNVLFGGNSFFSVYNLGGGNGNNIVFAGSGGNNYIINSGSSSNTIKIPQWMTSMPQGTVQFAGAYNIFQPSLGLGSLLIRYGTEGGELHIVDFDPNDVFAEGPVQRFEFADRILTYEELVALGFDISGTSGNDRLTGTNTTDRFLGLAGDDDLSGGDGADTFTGGAGNDLVRGGRGDDTYVFNLGDGIDTIYDDAVPGEANRIVFGTGIAAGDVAFVRDEPAQRLLIQVGSGGTDHLVLEGFDPTGLDGSLVVSMLEFADGSTLNLADLFPLNQAPSVANPLADQSVPEDAPLTVEVPANAFADADAGDTLTYNASLADGTALPAWLIFDPATRTFSGTPDDAQVGSLALTVTATDTGNLSASDTFTLTVQNVNEAPTVANLLADQQVTQGTSFSFVVPTTTWTDEDAIHGDTLTYSATRADGSALPSWLTFDALTRTFSGTPQGPDIGTLDVRVTVTDSGVLSARDIFALTVLPITGTVGNDTLSGTSGDDVLLGMAGDDTLQGLAGNDVLDGGAGADWLMGGVGDDTVQLSVDGVWGAGYVAKNSGSPGSAGTGQTVSLTGKNRSFDVLQGDAGVDRIVGSAGDDVLALDDAFSPFPGTAGPRVAGVELIDVGDGHDVVDLTSATYGYGDVTLLGGPGDDTLWSNAGNDRLEGGAGNDNLYGGAGVDYLLGGEGNDTLDGAGGADTLVGGLGNDTYLVDTINDAVSESVNEGTDTVKSSISYALGANLENLTLIGTAAVTGTGNTFNNVLRGNSAANVLTGGAGNDTYVVSMGDTVVENANEGIDTVQSDVSWTLGANLENLTLTGTAAINATGNSAANTLAGNGVANWLAGGAGNDTLKGGLGNDTYLVNRNEGRDVIAENDSTVGNSDLLLYGATINPLDLVLSRQVNDLRLAIHGSTDYVTIQNWYGAPTIAQLETIQAGNGQTLLNTQVDQLIQAMATFSQQTGLTWDQAIDQRPQDVQTVLAASWQ